MSEAEFTESEQFLYEGFSAFRDHKPFKSMQVLRGYSICLQCGNSWGSLAHPCICKQKKGSIVRPDFFLLFPVTIAFDSDGFTHSREIIESGVVRVDGGIHTKNRKHMMWDYYQVMELRGRGHKIFIIKNEEVQTEMCCRAIAYYILSMLYDDNLYQQYLRSGDMKARCRRPL